MAVAYVWPGTLPQHVERDFAEDGGVLIAATPTDKGPPKQRYLGVRPDVLSVSLQMSSAQVETFRTFVGATLRGTARFGFPHPRTASQVEVRIVPSADGKLYDVGYLAPNLWRVAFAIRVLP